jgi:hypothetical protein
MESRRPAVGFFDGTGFVWLCNADFCASGIAPVHFSTYVFVIAGGFSHDRGNVASAEPAPLAAAQSKNID